MIDPAFNVAPGMLPGLKKSAAISGQRPPLRPNTSVGNKDAKANFRSQAQTQNVGRGTNNRRKTKVDTPTPVDYLSVAGMMMSESSSDSSDSFNEVESRSFGFPIDSGRSNFVACNFETKNVVNTITDDFLYKITNEQLSVKQNISLARFWPASNAYDSLPNTSVIKDQFSNTFDRWTTQIQEIRLNTNMYNFWDKVKVYKYIHTVIRALSIYVSLDSILAIDEPVGEVNRVNTVQKAYFNDPELLVIKDSLRRKLLNQWLPPNMSTLILWTFQLYRTAPLWTCHQYRFVPSPNLCRAAGVAGNTNMGNLRSEMRGLISILDEVDMVRVRSILRSSLPNGSINRIPVSCNRPNYDQKHHEIFANQPALYHTSGTPTGNPGVFPHFTTATIGDYISYGMSVDPTGNNGFAFSLSQNYLGDASGAYVPDSDFFNAYRGTGDGGETLKVNQWYADPVHFNADPDNPVWKPINEEGHAAFDECGYIHLTENDATTGSVVRSVSRVPFGYQRVYFDTYNQRLLVVKEVFRALFTC